MNLDKWVRMQIEVVEDEHWIWRGRKYGNGTPYFEYDRRYYSAQRWIAQSVRYDILLPDEHVYEGCGIRGCCSPLHMVVGTYGEKLRALREMRGSPTVNISSVD